MGQNSRSTVGTATDAQALLRLIFSRASTPHVGTSSEFSFNVPEGWCPACEGSGERASLDMSLVVDESKSLNQGAITAPGHAVGEWYWKTYGESDRLDPDKKIQDYTPEERSWFFDQERTKVKNGKSSVSYEGLIARIRRLWIDRPDPPKAKQILEFVQRISTTATCPECGGTRLKRAAREAKVAGRTIVELAAMQISELAAWADGLAGAGKTPVAAVAPVAPWCGTLPRCCTRWSTSASATSPSTAPPAPFPVVRRSASRWYATWGRRCRT